MRTERNLSYAVLAEQTGMSLSYLNEIEKGKKFPKEDKIELLANALQTSVEELTSAELKNNLAPVGDLLRSNFLSELPLELFGIDLQKVVEIIADAPLKVGAFISTLVELSRNYALREENFYFGALRAYLELNNNYFEDIEELAAKFIREHRLSGNYTLPVSRLQAILQKKYGYTIVEDGLKDYPNLRSIRSVYQPRNRHLLLNSQLSSRQRAFQLAKELGFHYLGLKERAYTSSLLRVHNFDEALNHFKAGYFAAALLINREAFLKDIRQFFGFPAWNSGFFVELMDKYQATPEMLFQRITNLAPRYFGLQKLFLLRMIHNPHTGEYELDKEMHLERRHHPQGSGLGEHYCRRWISLTLLQDMEELNNKNERAEVLIGAQRSKYFGTEDEYVCFTIARRPAFFPQRNISVTIGFLVDKEMKAKIKWWNDPLIPRRIVNQTCERCTITDCKERAAPPVIAEQREQRQLIQDDLQRLMGA